MQRYRYGPGEGGLATDFGTHLTNDVGRPAINMVMKMVECNGQPVAKVSDSPGKGMCDNLDFLRYLMLVFQISEQTAAAT